MKKFLKNTSLFSLASFIIIIIIVSIPWHLIKSKSNFKLIENKSLEKQADKLADHLYKLCINT